MKRHLIPVLSSFIVLSLCGTDEHKKIPTQRTLTPRSTPPGTPPLHSPKLSKKDLPAEIFSCSAEQVGIRTNSGEEQNLQTYLHHNFHLIHGQLQDQQKILDTLSKQHGECLLQGKATVEEMKKELEAKIENSCKPVAIQQDKSVEVAINEYQKKPLDEAYQDIIKEIEDVKTNHNERLKDLETMQTVATDTSWTRKLSNKLMATSLVATLLYHSSTLLGAISQTVSAGINTSVAQCMPYAYIPATLLLVGSLAVDLHSNLQGNTFRLNRNLWRTYFENQKWQHPNPSNLFLSTAIMGKTVADNLYTAVKSTCTLLTDTGIGHILLAASVIALASKQKA